MVEHAYGCIPFMRMRSRELVALMILRHGGYWEFPKGKPEEGETEEATALRELREETGLVGVLAPEPPIDTSYLFHRNGVAHEKKVRYFFCRVPDAAPVTIEKREVNDFVWLPLEDLMDRATYPQMKEVARKVLQTLAD
jgi:8-oxo-dGTP pyrophosphatase MutT (NUDIX family)